MSAAARRSGPRFSPLGAWNQVPPADVRDQLRLAFARWGLPGRLRVDNGAPWGSKGDWPTELALWLIGLGVGVTWNTPRRPQENGVVERSQGTVSNGLGGHHYFGEMGIRPK
jgi:transposase InsO family protein